MKGVDRLARSPSFLTWIQDPDNRDEVLTLYYTAQRNRRSPSYYAFGMYDVRIPRQSEYEVDAYVTMIGVEHEAENARELEQRLKNQ